jgi:hypothetical protein
MNASILMIPSFFLRSTSKDDGQTHTLREFWVVEDEPDEPQPEQIAMRMKEAIRPPPPQGYPSLLSLLLTS